MKIVMRTQPVNVHMCANLGSSKSDRLFPLHNRTFSERRTDRWRDGWSRRTTCNTVQLRRNGVQIKWSKRPIDGYLVEVDERIEELHVAEDLERRLPVILDLSTGACVGDTVWFLTLHDADRLHDETNSGRRWLHRLDYCNVLQSFRYVAVDALASSNGSDRSYEIWESFIVK